ncbi:MAG: TlpA disulfide reductase family protein [Bacteroidota bacterium]
MRKNVSAILILAVIFSCAKHEKDYAIFSGKIMEAGLDSIQLTHWSGYKKTIEINEDSTFLDTIEIKDFNTFNLKIRRKQAAPTVYLENGYNLHVTITTKGYENSIVFSGNGEGPNNYFHAKKQITNSIKGDDSFTFLDVKEGEYEKRIDVIKSGNLRLLDNAKVDEKFKAFELENIKYDELYDYGLYYFNMKNKVGRSSDGVPKEYVPPRGFMPHGFFKLNVDDHQLYNNSYSYYILNWLFLSRDFNSKFTEKGMTTNYLDSVLDGIKVGAFKNKMVQQFGRSLINPQKEKSKKYYDYFMGREDLTTETKSKLKEYYSPPDAENTKKKITDLVSGSLNGLERGASSPKFVGYRNYSGGNTSLDDLTGKYVYIDVWATWCAPCKMEIPFLNKVERQYHGKNIEFVSISVDETYGFDSWQKMVKEKKMTGIQLFADNAFKSQFIKDYKIRMIPRFILIDPEGNVVSAVAPKPSNPKLIELFDELGI